MCDVENEEKKYVSSLPIVDEIISFGITENIQTNETEVTKAINDMKKKCFA